MTIYNTIISSRDRKDHRIRATYSGYHESDDLFLGSYMLEDLGFDIEPHVNRLTQHSHKVGQMVKGEGIYLGIWEPSDLEGVSLGKVFDIYVSPKKLQNSYPEILRTTFNRAVQHVAELKNWFNHDGAHFESAAQIYTAIREGREKELENWFIPTIDILGGFSHLEDPKNVKFNPDNLYDYNEEGAFYDLYKRKRDMWTPEGYPTERFFSCSQHPVESSQNFVSTVQFDYDGTIEYVHKDGNILNVLPVRAKLRTDLNEKHAEKNTEEPNWYIKALQMFPL